MKFIRTIRDIFSIEELRTRILFTLGILIVFRVGSFIIIPGVEYGAVAASRGEAEGILGVLDSLLGQAFSGKSIFALGIMPYISASIVVQLLGVAVPYFQKLQKDGESGRNKMNQITRFLTIAICLVQGIGYNQLTIADNFLTAGVNPVFFQVYATLILIAGTMFCVWLGEKITEKGVGNGVSLLIMVGIVSRFIPSIYGEVTTIFADGGPVLILLEMVAWVGIIMGIILITQAVRQVPLSYAKQMINNKVYGGQRNYLPLKVNTAGVMPIIFAQALMFVPGFVFEKVADGGSSEFLTSVANAYRDPTTWTYSITMAILILIFTYFYTAITIHPNQIADDLKRQGGFIPGVKPGQPTADYIDEILSKITLPGAIFIAVVAILPAFARMIIEGSVFAEFFGGTSLLILVGVVLDTAQQIDSYLLMRKYDGLMKSGKVKGRAQDMPALS